MTESDSGRDDSLVAGRLDVPSAGLVSCIIQVAASAINRADLLRRNGISATPGASNHGAECQER